MGFICIQNIFHPSNFAHFSSASTFSHHILGSTSWHHTFLFLIFHDVLIFYGYRRFCFCYLRFIISSKRHRWYEHHGIFISVIILIQMFQSTSLQTTSSKFYHDIPSESTSFFESFYSKIIFDFFVFDFEIQEPIVVQEGQEVDMSIKVQGKYVPDSVKWYQNGAPIFGSDTRKLWSEGRRYYLTLLEASLRDAGHYRCESTTKLGTTISDFVIKVLGMDCFPYFCCRFTFRSSSGKRILETPQLLRSCFYNYTNISPCFFQLIYDF